MSKRDYYEVLGLSKNADAKEIKRAYRSLAAKYHPDKNGGDKKLEEKFKEVQEAYDVLKAPDQREKYDRFGHAGVNQGGTGGHEGFGGGGFQGFDDVFKDFFEDIFGDGGGGANRGQSSDYTHGGRGRTGNRPQKGSDLEYEMYLTLEQAVKGCSINLKVNCHLRCNECNGSGSDNNTSAQSCSMCNGIGQVRMQKGFFTIQQTCPSCNGSGTMIKNPCKKCSGQGRYRDNHNLTVKIPAGVDEDDFIKLAHQGDAGLYGGNSGDLYIKIHIKSHTIFTRNKKDLNCEIPINFAIAALGGSIEIPTLDGKVKLKIPAGTQANKVFKIKGKGVTSLHRIGKGDLMCKIIPEIPVNLTPQQRGLLEKFVESMQMQNEYTHQPKSKSWLESMKSFFEDFK